MKQAYKAPRLEVVQYSLHEAIAANCSNKVYNHTQEACGLTELGKSLQEDGYTFLSDNCGETGAVGYCYFTSNNVMFNS